MSGTQFGIELADDRRAVLRFDSFPRAAHDRLLAALERIEKRLEMAVLAQVPSITGKLKATVGGRVYDHDTRIAAVVGVRAPNANAARKAAAVEYGSHNPVTVRAHAAKLAHIWSRAISPITVHVPEHRRVPNIDPRRFLRGPIQTIRAEALAELRAAVGTAAAETSA